MLASQLIVDGRSAETVVVSPSAVLQVLADGSRLATVLGPDAATATARLDDLVARDQLQARPGSVASSASTVPSIRP